MAWFGRYALAVTRAYLGHSSEVCTTAFIPTQPWRLSHLNDNCLMNLLCTEDS